MRTNIIIGAIALLTSAIGTNATAAPSGFIVGSLNKDNDVGIVALAHAQVSRHCHNVHARTYCHKADRLPMNWPPLSDTPVRAKK